MEMFALLDPARGEYQSNHVFRGHADASWGLVPSIWPQRLLPAGEQVWKPPGDLSDFEIPRMLRLLYEFVAAADRQNLVVPGGAEKLLPILKDAIERDGRPDPAVLVGAEGLAQHYGVPTGLLDWTENPLVAMFFAAERSINNKPPINFAVYIAPSVGQRLETWNSRAEPGTIDFIPGTPILCGGYIFENVVGAGNANLGAQRGKLMRPIMSARTPNDRKQATSVSEKFQTTCYPVDLVAFLKEVAPLSHPEIAANFKPLAKLTLPSSEGPELLWLLDRYGINSASLYPGLRGAALYAVQAYEQAKIRKTVTP